MYEDFRDRYNRKNHLTLTPIEFDAKVVEMAERTALNNGRLSESDLLEVGVKDEVRRELLDTGILQPQMLPGKYKVNRKTLVAGFGFLLADEVMGQSAAGQLAADEAVASYLEPHNDMDIKGEICGAAVYQALKIEEFPLAGRLALLKAWVSNQNIIDKAHHSLSVYFSQDIEAFCKLSEHVWSSRRNDHRLEETLLIGMLKCLDDQSCKNKLIPIFERWTGMFHIHGNLVYRMREDDADKIKNEIENRIGQAFEIGEFDYHSYTLNAINEDGAMWLWRPALTVISHASDLRPYLKSLFNVIITDQIMDTWIRAEEVLWILHSNWDEELWAAFETEIDALLATESVVLKGVAYRALGLLGTEKAYKKRESLPKELTPNNRMFEKYENEPCTSGFRWRKDHLERCMDREDVPLRSYVHNINAFVADPDIAWSETARKRIVEHSQIIQVDDLDISLSRDTADQELEKVRPCLCVIAPGEAPRIMRKYLQTARDRDGMSIRAFSHRLPRLSLLFTDDEYDAIKIAWERSLAIPIEEDKESRYTEARLFCAMLDGLTASEQLRLFISRPEGSSDLTKFWSLFKAMDKEELNDVIDSLSMETDDLELRRTFWFFSANATKLDEETLIKIASYINHPESPVRRSVCEVIYHSINKVAAETIVSSQWAWNGNNWFHENLFGSLILCNHGEELPEDKANERIHPGYLKHWYRNKLKSFDIEDQLEQIIKTIESIRLKSPSDYSFSFSGDWAKVVAVLVKKRPDQIDAWIREVDNTDGNATVRFYRESNFYLSLLRWLMKYDPNRGLKLLDAFRKPSSVRTTDSLTGLTISQIYVFEAKENESVAKVWRDLLEECTSDLKLFEYMLSAQLGGQSEWLFKTIQRFLDSESLYDQARGVTLAGYLDVAEAENMLLEFLERPKTWVRDISEKSLDRFRNNKWAKDWYLRFLESEDDERAWEYYQLFLQCVDRRYYLWRNDMEQVNLKNFSRRKKNHLIANKDVIKKALKENENDWEKTFLGSKCIKETLWPWLGIKKIT